MADTKISELPVATAIASPDVAPVVRNGVTKRADVSLFGSFLSRTIVRVDPSGNDGTGIIGDLSKPFLTVQAAINACGAIDPVPTYATIQVGLNHFAEDATIAYGLPKIIFEGVSAAVSQPFDSLIIGDAAHNSFVYFYNCSVKNVTQTANVTVSIGLFTSILKGDTTGDHIFIWAYAGSFANDATINIAPDGGLTIVGLSGPKGGEDVFGLNNRLDIAADPDTTTVELRNTLARDVTCDQLLLSDSLVTRNLTANSIVYSNLFLNPATFDFSTLPTSEPSEVGKAWIDTTGGFNIVKVHL